MTSIRIITRRLAHGERGSTLVEFAIASMMFFTVIFGTIEFTLAVWRYNMVSDLAQEGARYASVHGAGSTTPLTSGNVQTYVQSRSLGLTVSAVTTPDGAPGGLAAGSPVTVVVTSSFTPMAGMLPGGTITLTSTAKMIMTK